MYTANGLIVVSWPNRVPLNLLSEQIKVIFQQAKEQGRLFVNNPHYETETSGRSDVIDIGSVTACRADQAEVKVYIDLTYDQCFDHWLTRCLLKDVIEHAVLNSGPFNFVDEVGAPVSDVELIHFASDWDFPEQGDQ